MLSDGLEMLHHCNIAVRKAQVYADLARTHLAADGQAHRGDELRRILTDAQQQLQRLVNSVEGDLGRARSYGPGRPRPLASLSPGSWQQTAFIAN
jgi:hypothetical protein